MNKLCWNITHKCNRNCKYCFREEKMNDLSLEENIKILYKLIEEGVKKITWSGGEPTEYEGIYELLKLAKENNIYNKFITNTSNFNNESSYNIIKYIDEITFSIDFVDDNMNKEFGRGKNYFLHIQKVIDYVTKNFPDCIFSVNTVVMKANINLLDDIYKEISAFKLKKWKLIQFCSFRGLAKENKELFNVPDEEFVNVLNQFQKVKNDFEIEGHTNNQMENEHIILTSMGSIIKS